MRFNLFGTKKKLEEIEKSITSITKLISHIYVKQETVQSLIVGIQHSIATEDSTLKEAYAKLLDTFIKLSTPQKLEPNWQQSLSIFDEVPVTDPSGYYAEDPMIFSYQEHKNDRQETVSADR